LLRYARNDGEGRMVLRRTWEDEQAAPA